MERPSTPTVAGHDGTVGCHFLNVYDWVGCYPHHVHTEKIRCASTCRLRTSNEAQATCVGMFAVAISLKILKADPMRGKFLMKLDKEPCWFGKLVGITSWDVN